MEPGLLGAVAGGAIGIVGGAIGTYLSVKRTHGPQERSFMIKVAAVAWTAVALFALGFFFLPESLNVLLWVLFAIALTLAVRWSNRRQESIRRQEGSTVHQPLGDDSSGPAPAP